MVNPAPSPPPTHDVPDGTVAEVLAWVGTDLLRAKAALAVEQGKRGRASLLRRLGAMLP